MRGLLVRQIPVRLVNLSLSGFLLESDSELDVGSTWELRVDLGGAKLQRPGPGRQNGRATRGRRGCITLGASSRGESVPTQDSMRLAVRAFESDGQPQP